MFIHFKAQWFSAVLKCALASSEIINQVLDLRISVPVEYLLSGKKYARTLLRTSQDSIVQRAGNGTVKGTGTNKIALSNFLFVPVLIE